MEKAALFIHGWAMDDRIFHKKWIRDLGAPLFELFSEEFGYVPVSINLPGNYLLMNRDFDNYASLILKWTADHPEFDNIVLVGYSMGGITIRRALQVLEFPEWEREKGRIERAIIIGTPNHGTEQPLANTLSRVITTIGHKFLSNHITELMMARSSFLEETPCYRDLDPEGSFMRELNDHYSRSASVKVDNIWTLTDTVVEPTHSAILPGVPNHMINVISVNHFNILYRKETVEKVRSIMRGTARTTGPQDFPPVENCVSLGPHDWWPQYVHPLLERTVHWRCRSCGRFTRTKLLPEPLGCPKSIIRDGPHSWRRIRSSYSFRFRCRKCGASIWYPDLSNDLESTLQHGGDPPRQY